MSDIFCNFIIIGAIIWQMLHIYIVKTLHIFTINIPIDCDVYIVFKCLVHIYVKSYYMVSRNAKMSPIKFFISVYCQISVLKIQRETCENHAV